MKPQRALGLALVAAALATPASAAGYKLVVNPGNSSAALTRAEVARIFLKKVTAWPDGRPVAAIDQERVSDVRKAFSEEVHQKNPDAVSAYWQVLVFSGRDVPPKTRRSDEDVLAFVRANPGAIGYVSPDTHLEGVRAVAIR